MTKIAKIYKHNYISLKWLIHEEKMDMRRVQQNNSNFLMYLYFSEIAILKGILHVFNAKILSWLIPKCYLYNDMNACI